MKNSNFGKWRANLFVYKLIVCFKLTNFSKSDVLGPGAGLLPTQTPEASDRSDLFKLRFGLTTNCNESFNSKIWRRTPKTQFTEFTSVKIGLFDAVICHNDEYLSRTALFNSFGFKEGEFTVAALKPLIPTQM